MQCPHLQSPREEWRTSTRYNEAVITAPEFTPTPTRRPQRDIQRAIPRMPMRTRRMDLTAGVAIVPRRIDFDALDDDFNGEDMGDVTRRRVERSTPQQPEVTAPGTYRLRRTRAPQFPREIKRQYAPRMTRMTPCGKCLRNCPL
ncbi:uncharacterized protein LOC114929520 [Nylanderia fulva]|uniref:uncharacterized protein LOC114929520 n=1 Tax=Nylanderia fulva TaxID=613905 RepID=UPI0010FBA1C2|nr:uncharacterized protein LOC114929520 [Nylanderia fulva]